MADEAKIIVEAVGLDGGAGASSAGDRLREDADKRGDASSSGGQSQYLQDLIDAITKGEDSPLGATVNPGGVADASKEALNSFSSVIGPGEGETFSTIASSIPEGGGTAGAIAETPLVRAAATTAGAASSLGGALTTAGMVVGGFIAAWTVATGILYGITSILDSILSGLTESWKGLSGQSQAADALKAAELTNTKLNTEQGVGEAYSRVVNVKTGLESDMIEIRAYLIQILGPIVEALYLLVRILLAPIKAALDAIMYVYNLFLPYFQAILDLIEWAVGWIGIKINKPPDPQDLFTKDLLELLNPANERNKTAYKPYQDVLEKVIGK